MIALDARSFTHLVDSLAHAKPRDEELTMPARRLAALDILRRAGAFPRRRIDSILSQRGRLIAELIALRGRGCNSRHVENALQLLTRWWCRASWSAREDLLKSADWLVRLERTEREKLG